VDKEKLFIKDSGLKISHKEMERFHIPMGISMRETGKLVKNMETEPITITTEADIKVNGKTTKSMEEVLTYIQMVTFMMENGSMVNKQDLPVINLPIKINMMVSSEIRRETEREQ